MSKESLKGKAIVISGVFEKYSRKELKDIIGTIYSNLDLLLN